MMKGIIAVALLGLVLTVGGAGYMMMTNHPMLKSAAGQTTNMKTMMSATYTATDLAQHNSLDSCWLAIKNKTYDVTSYVSQHPGGVRNIEVYCGKEATSIFAQIHSNRAWDLLGKYLIGSYAG